jgi:hypothetical protein
VNNLKFILLKDKRPTSSLTSKLVVGHQPLDRLVVGIQNELGAIKIGHEMYNNPYNSKTLPFVCRVVVFNLVVASKCIGDNKFLAFFIKLAKNNTNTKSTPVSVYDENLAKIKSSHNGEF